MVSELFIKQELMKTLPQIDALLFDVDGVLLDVSRSFRTAIVQTVQWIAVHQLELENTGPLLEESEIEGFKFAGGFNDDWDLTSAATAFAIAKWTQTGAKDTLSLREAGPSWKEFTDSLRRRGGGLQEAEGYVLEELTPTQRREFARRWNPKNITRLFQEFYAGDDACRDLYGFDPETIHGPGLYKQEKVIVNPELIPAGLKIGLVTGRAQPETRLAMREAKLSNRIKPEHWITPERGAKKPDGRTLQIAQEAMGFKYALYVGDILDDLNTVLNYRALRSSGKARVASAIVLSGPGGAAHKHEFLEKGVDVMAPDVNFLLEYLGNLLASR